MNKASLCAVLLSLAAFTGAARANVVEGFDDIASLAAKGYVLRNAGTPPVGPAFSQGNADRVFASQAGAANAYLDATYASAGAGGTVDDWLISPVFSTTAGSTISFWVRGADDPQFTDLFQYGLSAGGIGAADFILSATMAAPTGGWTRYALDVAGTGIAGSVGRFAFRYTGPADGANYIGLDTLSLPLPEPSGAALVALGLAGLFLGRRRNAVTRR